MHLLALRVSSFLSLKPDAVLKHWASAKILRSKPSTTGSGQDAELGEDDDVCKSIVNKFEQLGGANVSYADIAKRAWEVGRAGLATKVCLSRCSRMCSNGLFSFWIMSRARQIRFLCYSS